MLASTLPDLPPKTRAGIKAVVALAAVLFCLPFILCVALDAGFLGLANEPLAYRFFYSERIFAGETVVVGVGYLISVLHHAVYGLLHLFPSVAGGSLERRLDLFALLTNGILSAIVCSIFYLAAQSAKLKTTDLALLVLVALMPIFGTTMSGFDYALMADYHFLNIVLYVATLFLFQLFWRRNERAATRFEVVLLAVFVGLAMANKITMLVVAGVVLVPAVAIGEAGWRESAIRSLLAALGVVTAFVAVHLLSYLGNIEATLSGLSAWWRFASRPGGEPAFWDNWLSGFIQGYNYGYFIVYCVSIFIVVVPALAMRRDMGKQVLWVTLFCVLGVFSSIFFILKRPAGSTLFESTMFSFTLTAVLLTVASNRRSIRYVIVTSFVGWVAFAIGTFDRNTTYGQVARSRADSHIKWNAFNEARRLAGTRPIEVIFPDNSFRHEGAFELLLKAAADFPTWTITTGQKSIMDRYAPGMTFRHNQSAAKPADPYGDGRVLVWFDGSGIPPLSVQYPELAKAVSRPGVVQVEPSGYSHLTMHIALIPEKQE